ncbi:uncharacterized protein LOC127103528 [Lathyrus oleraceus]|uniref:uncharacterized protein LOC127103528 n=1 Tax=Pisum sativum TaxID=3888 RepID=UPI0021D0C467|nr:uncharacterized protein LOC127103528 [Pisum sativum]
MERYFLKYVHRKKEIEFLELEQRNSIVVEYAARFEELVKFCPYYNGVATKASKCFKFENGLCPEIKQGLGYQQIWWFLELVNKCRIYNEDIRAWSSHYKSMNEKTGKQLNRGKLYSSIADKGKHKVSQGKNPSGGGTPASIKCYRCGGAGHDVNECKSDEKINVDFKTNVPNCYNCGEPSHINTHYQKPKKAQFGGKVFAQTGSQTTSSDRLIRGTYC